MLRKHKIFCIGNTIHLPEFCLQSNKYEVLAIICEITKFDNNLLTYSLVRNIPILPVSNKNELSEKILDFANLAEYAIMYSFGIILPENILNMISVYNIHPSKLPYYKGRHPTFWGIFNNELDFGISLHVVNKKIDEGEIISQKIVKIYFWEDHSDLMNNLLNKIPELLDDLYKFNEGVKNTVQNRDGDYHPPVTKEIITININTHTPAEIFNLVRAQRQYKGAIYVNNNQEFQIKEIQFESNDDFINIREGEVFSFHQSKFIKYKNNIAIKLINFKENQL